MSRIRPARFVHVVYRTRRFEQMVQWYETVFDAKVRYQNPVLAFLSYDEEHHRIALINLAIAHPDATEDRRGVIGVDHVAYTYESVSDLFENYAQLKDKGILPYWCIHHGVTMSMYYADPDGNNVELQTDNFDTAEEAQEFLESDAFAENPIGVLFDPDELAARFQAGEPAAELVKRR
jgi:catechol-2,3-dioxygenase